jgi:uncharacterized membrane protein YbhN (UPF0104 family)
VKLSVSLGLLWLLFSRIDLGRLWTIARQASIPWLIAALAAYAVSVLVGIWRWHQLLDIQHVRVPGRTVSGSFLVALFFNNFLPTNIGGDLIRIRDTSRFADSTTLATTVVVADRVIGLLGLVLFAAFGTAIGGVGGGDRLVPISPWVIWAGFALGAAASGLVLAVPAGLQRTQRPLTFLRSGWVGDQFTAFAQSLTRFRAAPGGLAWNCAAGVLVQASNVAFYVGVAKALRVNIAAWDMAVIVPFTSLVQAVPVSINGFGVREATFSVFFTRLGLPIESALLVSLVATGLIMGFSLIGAAVYVGRQQPAAETESGVPSSEEFGMVTLENGGSTS